MQDLSQSTNGLNIKDAFQYRNQPELLPFVEQTVGILGDSLASIDAQDNLADTMASATHDALITAAKRTFTASAHKQDDINRTLVSLEAPSSSSIFELDESNNDVSHLDTSFEPYSGSTISDADITADRRALTSLPQKTTKRERPRSHTPRPPNSFILYRREKHMEIMAQYKDGKTLNNNIISKIVANMWREESPEVKAKYAAKADEEKRAHMLKYPDYKYRPRKGAGKVKNANKKQADKAKKVLISAVPQGLLVPHRPVQLMGSSAAVQDQRLFRRVNTSYPQGFAPYGAHHLQTPMELMQIDRMSNSIVPISDSGFTLVSPDELAINRMYDDHTEFLQSDPLMQNTSYASPWTNSLSSAGVWEMGLDQKPLGSLSPDTFLDGGNLAVI